MKKTILKNAMLGAALLGAVAFSPPARADSTLHAVCVAMHLCQPTSGGTDGGGAVNPDDDGTGIGTIN